MHYFRTTNDGRIVFGWGGGPFAFGARLGGRVERDADDGRARPPRTCASSSRSSRAARSPTPGAARSTSPRATSRRSARSTAGAVHYAFGFTGNGVGPSHLAGRILAARAAGETPEVELPAGDPPPVPPEPLAWAGGMVVRAAFLRRERIEAEGRRADPLTRAVCAAPEGARHPRLAADTLRSGHGSHLGLSLLLLLPPRGE